MDYQTRLSVTELLSILDREVGKKQDSTFEIKKLYSILWELNQRSVSAFIPEEYTAYLTTSDRLALVYGATVDGVVIEEGLVVNQGGTIYTLTTNDPSLTASWTVLSNNGVVTFPDLQIEGQSSINYNNIFNPPVGAEGINVIQVQARSTANIAGTYDNGTLGVGATFTTSGSLTTLDDYTLLVNDEVALINQSNPIHNGIYTVTSIGATTLLTRALDGDETIDLYPSEITVANGTLYANRKYRQITVNPVIGTSNIEYAAITIDDVAAPSYVSGKTIYVDRLSNYATDTRTGLSRYNRDRPFSTIQAAINVATATDTILIMAGSYTENLTLSGSLATCLLLQDNTIITGTIGCSSAVALTEPSITGLGNNCVITNGTASATITAGTGSSSTLYPNLKLKSLRIRNTSTGFALNSIAANSGFELDNCIVSTVSGIVISRDINSGVSNIRIYNSILSSTSGHLYRPGNGNTNSDIFEAINSTFISSSGNLMAQGVGSFDQQSGINSKWKNCIIRTSRLFDWSGGSSNTRGDLTMVNCYVNSSSTSTAFNCVPITGGTKIMIVGNTFISASSGNLFAFTGVSVYAYNNTSNKVFPALTGGANNSTDANLDADLI